MDRIAISASYSDKNYIAANIFKYNMVKSSPIVHCDPTLSDSKIQIQLATRNLNEIEWPFKHADYYL